MKPASLLASLIATAQAGDPRRCAPFYFSNLTVFGTEVLDVTTKVQLQYTTNTTYRVGLDPAVLRPIDFCNVTVSFTHPGWDDLVHVYVWLPLNGKWNERYMSVGGGGLVTGGEGALAQPVQMGYAAANTDGGHSVFGTFAELSNSTSWSLTSPGNTNWYGINDFASRAIGDLPKFGKGVVERFYGVSPKFSYWAGCSTGGRQGLMSAQRYGTDHDGILAASPAINWDVFSPAGFWPQVVMFEKKYWPSQCEFEALRQAAIEACDGLDGVMDGVIAAQWLCKFDARQVVGRRLSCAGEERRISRDAAEVANRIWEGPRERDGRWIWYGNTYDTPTSVKLGLTTLGLANTECDDDQRQCYGVPFPVTADVIRNWIVKDPSYDTSNMDEDALRAVIMRSKNEFASVIGTSDPDLTEFKEAGGKMITWHGIADQLIPENGTVNYYERVEAFDPHVRDYYRFFEAPGVFHCAGGAGPNPTGVFDALVKWVEQGVAPDTLHARTLPSNTTNSTMERPLCLYPLVAAYKGGNVNDAASYTCAETYV
ncbi:tannase and feruloyl esterase [Piedraia hortae CBS 480.64]|uniref:Carboxylic ester hydrolase n=1 Tax=Piedraia hortae CBS 480.64 TaxID=1314780 RepID=A0A6A7BWI7_9PEZI|nr:tannase and feruloyl esterase [Piedraia hortae CBS 480.64]